MKSIKKTFFSVLLVLLVLSPIFASTKLASTDDGTIYLLKENNTYEKFIPKTYEKDMGYEIKDSNSFTFLEKSWDDVTLTALGNYLPNRGYKLGSYTDGEYFLLELKSDIKSNNKIYISDHNIPSIKLDDGTLIKGTNERIQTTASSSTKSYYQVPYTPYSYYKTLTYSVLYNIPEGKTPIAIVFSDSDENITTADLGTYKAL